MDLIRVGALVVAMASTGPAMAQASDPLEQLKLASELIGEVQACVASGLSGAVPQADLVVVRELMQESDRMARRAWVQADKSSRTPQEDLLLRGYARAALALISEADDYRMMMGY